ncbi:MAG: GTP 3',8-cyclase MoaA [Xanthomonadaceae bacterium]|nr:GTP 3',8-cyclase MoaA [Xanthomonadaceae bacterium]MDE2178395.1 GTP 3',8-cyclase MoaA [Xanthomonadaceae bacterium]MDE2244810.1 GTP 3',8-cyclase MoaA [Xanthomonadaceae bacterium]
MNAPLPTPVRIRAATDARGRPLRDLRISVLDRCNFRCPYCMPADQYPEHHPFLQRHDLLSFEEIERLARVFAGLGVRKLRLTGGEPLLRRDLPLLVAKLAAIPGVEDLALTTNGVLLPRLAAPLRAAGLQRLTVSLDALDPAIFSRLSGQRGDVAEVLAGIAAAERAGFAAIKINCVVMRGVNEGEPLKLAAHFRGSGHLVRFIEYMDVGTLNDWRSERVVPSAEVLAQIAEHWELRALEPGYRGEVAQRHAYLDGAGEIGFISSVSVPFCGECTRARLSADGQLYTCLFAREGFDLRGPLRDGHDDAALAALITGRWSLRDDRYSERRDELRGAIRDRVEMYHVGG